MRKRQISPKLLGMLSEGKYRSVTDIVRRDPYLDMEMRGDDGVMIYYRGGKILTIHEDQGFKGLDEEYYPDKDMNKVVPQIDNIFDYFCKAKYIVDLHESGDKRKLVEKEFQQRVVYENNLSANATNTDYFIADVEWQDNETLGGRADIVAFRWNHMEHSKRILQLTLVEVKQGDGAIVTSETQNKKGEACLTAGLKKHYDDFSKFQHNQKYVQEVANDMLIVLRQKLSLRLVNGLDKLFKRGNEEVTPKLMETPDFIFLLANYHHYSTNLMAECEKLPDECRFCLSSFMGYGLYKDFIFTKKKMKEIFPAVFVKSK